MSYLNEKQAFIVPTSVETRTAVNGAQYTLIETDDGFYSDWSSQNYQVGVRYGIFYTENGRFRNIKTAFVSKEQCGTK